MGDGFISLDHAFPTVVAVHSVVTSADGCNAASADFLALCFEFFEERLCALGRYITAIEEGMYIDFLDVVLLRHFEQRIEMVLMAVYAARRNEAHKVQGTALFLHAVYDFQQGFVLEEVAVLDVAGDAGQLLIDDAAGTDVGVTNFGVAHLTIRQADVFAGSLQLAGLVFGKKSVEYGGIGYLYGVVLVVFVTEAAAIHDDEGHRCIFKSCHIDFLLLLKNTKEVGLEVYDFAEVLSLERCTAYESTVNIRLLHQVFDGCRLHAAAILDADSVSCRLVEFLGNSFADSFADFFSLVKGSRLARADSPNRFISDDEFSNFVCLEAFESCVNLRNDMVDVRASFTDFEAFTAADNRSNASSKGSAGALVYAFVRFTEVVTAFAMAEDNVIYTDFVEHTRGDFARESTFGFPMYILCANMDVGALYCFSDRGKSRSRRANHNVYFSILNQRSQSLNELNAFLNRVVHFPVTGNNRSSSHLYSLPVILLL